MKFTFCITDKSHAKYNVEIHTLNLIEPANDFILSERGFRCSKRNDFVLKRFPFPKSSLTDASIALTACKSYCGKANDCWGCSIDCNESCKWNAIPECGIEEKWSGLMTGDISIKPGMIDQI